MERITFKNWLAQHDEGLFLPDRPPLKGLPRINATPFTDAERKRFQAKPVKKAKPFAPTIKKVKEIVPNKMIPRLKPIPKLKPAVTANGQPGWAPR